jgi:hypothetical protein
MQPRMNADDADRQQAGEQKVTKDTKKTGFTLSGHLCLRWLLFKKCRAKMHCGGRTATLRSADPQRPKPNRMP